MIVPLHVRFSPVAEKIRFELNDRGMLLPLDDHAAQWSNLIGQIVREFSMYYPSLNKIESEKKERVVGNLMTHLDLTPHMQSKLWPKNLEGHRATFGQGIRSRPPPNIKQPDWDKQTDYWLDSKNAVRALQNAQNRAKSKAFCRQGSRSLTVLRDMHMESSKTREYPSLIQTYFDTHTVDGVFAQDEARLQYEEMLRLRDLGANTPTGFWGDEAGTSSLSTSLDARTPTSMSMRSDDRMSQLLTQLESQHEVGGGSESGGGGDDEPGADEDASRSPGS
ncbi:hypothetical protein Tco_0676628 [Tanacetum coccineum]